MGRDASGDFAALMRAGLAEVRRKRERRPSLKELEHRSRAQAPASPLQSR